MIEKQTYILSFISNIRFYGGHMLNRLTQRRCVWHGDRTPDPVLVYLEKSYSSATIAFNSFFYFQVQLFFYIFYGNVFICPEPLFSLSSIIICFSFLFIDLEEYLLEKEILSFYNSPPPKKKTIIRKKKTERVSWKEAVKAKNH